MSYCPTPRGDGLENDSDPGERAGERDDLWAARSVPGSVPGSEEACFGLVSPGCSTIAPTFPGKVRRSFLLEKKLVSDQELLNGRVLFLNALN